MEHIANDIQVRHRYAREGYKRTRANPRSNTLPRTSYIHKLKRQLIICTIIALLMAGFSTLRTDWAVNTSNKIGENLRYSVDYNALLATVGNIYKSIINKDSTTEEPQAADLDENI